MHNIWFICSSDDGHWVVGIFWLMWILSLWMFTYVFVWALIFISRIDGRGTAEPTVTPCLTFGGNCPFSRLAAPFYIPISSVWVFCFSHRIWHSWAEVFCVVILVGMKQCSRFAFPSWLMALNTLSCVYWPFLLRNVCSDSSTIYKTGLFFSLFSCMSFFIYTRDKFLFRYMSCKYFFPSHILDGIVCSKKTLHFDVVETTLTSRGPLAIPLPYSLG